MEQSRFPLDKETLKALENNTDLMAVLANIATDKDTRLILCGCKLEGNYRTEGYVWMRTEERPVTGEILYHPRSFADSRYGWQIRTVTDSTAPAFSEVRPMTVNGAPLSKLYSIRYIADVYPGGGDWNEMTHIEDVSNVTLRELIAAESDERKNADEALQEQIDDLVADAVPKGVICMWRGTTPPRGWALCDGQNGTPNLIDRFVIAAGGKYKAGSVGGEERHTLSTDEMPYHKHTATVSGGSHNHAFSISAALPNGSKSAHGDGSSNQRVDLETITGWTSYDGGHSHTASVGYTGGSNPHNNMPPYYALAYIMKI